MSTVFASDIVEGDRVKFTRNVTAELLQTMLVSKDSVIYYERRIKFLKERHGLRVDQRLGTVGTAIAPMTDGMFTFTLKSSDGKTYPTEYLPKSLFERRPRFEVGDEVILAYPTLPEMLTGKRCDARAEKFNDTATALHLRFGDSKGVVTLITETNYLTVRFHNGKEEYFHADCFEQCPRVGDKVRLCRSVSEYMFKGIQFANIVLSGMHELVTIATEEFGLIVDPLTGTTGEIDEPVRERFVTFRFMTKEGTEKHIFLPTSCFSIVLRAKDRVAE